jgi:nitronate monooxygenase
MSLAALLAETPVVQAGCGGGITLHELAAAVSDAGGLGTIGGMGAGPIAHELRAARALTDRPIAVNILLPFARRNWFEAAAEADVVVTHWGKPRRRAPGLWIHTCSSADEARAALAAGADGVIAQGVESGGHVRRTEPALVLLEQIRAAVPAGYPVLLAGGIAERADVQHALDAGAAAAIAGTRFVMSDESRAHPEYKRRLIEASETILTELFSAGWAASHRVIPNAATDHWLRDDPRGPALNRALNRLFSVGARYMPPSMSGRLAAAQKPDSRVLGPLMPSVDRPDNLLDAGALYAGETVARISDIRPARELVAALTP